MAVDLCRALDIQNVRQNLAKLLSDEKGVYDIYTPGGYQKMTVVNEPGFYRLIFMSRKPEAEIFKRWIFHDVLPTIRKYGFYGILPVKQALKLPIKEYVSYLGRLSPKQYDAYFEQFTDNQCLKHYRRLNDTKRIDTFGKRPVYTGL